MASRATAIQYVKDFINELQQNETLHLRKVYLYGSYVDDKADEYADIDVSLVADEFQGVEHVDVPLFVKELKNFYKIQPKTFSPEVVNNDNPFWQHIRETGIEIPLA
jgi:predicted nucleotidyltransferase